MTESEWDGCTDPQAILTFLRNRGRASERKLRLFAVASFRRIWPLLDIESDRRAVEVAERFADGQAGERDLRNAREAEPRAAFTVKNTVAWTDAYRVAWLACHDVWKLRCDAAQATRQDTRESICRQERATQARLLRDLFGSPPCPPRTSFSSLLTPGVVALARTIYDHRVFGLVPDLARMLEAAGCTDAELLGHLRSPGPHVRGCFALDLVLGRS